MIPITYDEDSYLKRFIDFFTVYQISLFVILRIINSHIISSYRLLLSEIRSMKNFIDTDLSLEDFSDDFKREVNNHYLHPDVKFLYKELLQALELHICSKKNHTNGDYDEKQYFQHIKVFNASLTSKELLIEARLANKEREWDGSMILRIIKNREMKILRAE